MNIAHEVLVELGLGDVPLVGIAKGPDRDAGRERFSCGQKRFHDAAQFASARYLQRLRDEAHRFALKAIMRRNANIRKIRSMVLTVSALRKRVLLYHFGSGRAVGRASLSELGKVEGISAKMAQRIYNHFNSDES